MGYERCSCNARKRQDFAVLGSFGQAELPFRTQAGAGKENHNGKNQPEAIGCTLLGNREQKWKSVLKGMLTEEVSL